MVGENILLQEWEQLLTEDPFHNNFLGYYSRKLFITAIGFHGFGLTMSFGVSLNVSLVINAYFPSSALPVSDSTPQNICAFRSTNSQILETKNALSLTRHQSSGT